MKKHILLLLAVFLLQSLAGCVPADQVQQPTSPDSQPTQPSEATVSTTLPQETRPPYSELLFFIYEDKAPFQSVKPDISQCQLGHLYSYHENSGEVAAICDEPVVCFGDNPSGFYFVKAAEPHRLYRTPLTDLTEQSVIYSSDFGAINRIYADDIGAAANVVMLTEGNQRGVLLDPTTGKAEVFVQQHYIDDAIIADLRIFDGKLTYSKVWFRGKLSEEDTINDHFYWVDNDSITLMPTNSRPAGFPYGNAYTLPPDDFFPFIYEDGAAFRGIYTKECVVGRLYLYDRNTKKLRMFPDEPATSCASNKDHIYFVKEAEPDTVYRADYTGENVQLVFRAEGMKLDLRDFSLVDGDGLLSLIADSNKAVVYYVAEQRLEILMEQEYIHIFGFDYEPDPYRLMICWHGRVSEDEEGIHPYKTYLDTGETVDWIYL